MSPNPPSTPVVSLSEAISIFETVDVALKDASGKQSAADEKFKAAQAAKETADATRSTAVASFNGALDSLIASALASKIPA